MISSFWWGSNTDKRKIHWINWKKTCLPKNSGGMGFRDLGAFNEALLAKQGWRIMTEPMSLMASVLKAKYFPKTHFLKAKQGHRPSYAWHCILKASWVLKKGCRWLVGNGSSINIWEDQWIHQQVDSKTWTTKPNNTNLTHVKDLLNPQTNSWNTTIINQVFFPSEANIINQIPTSNTKSDDVISWQGTKEGNYTVKSGYNAIMEWRQAEGEVAQHCSNSNNNTRWSCLWKIPNPPKQTHLMWRIFNDALPVKTKLLSKGLICDSLCPRCQKGPETIDHVFFLCDQARQIWFSSPLNISTSNSQAPTYKDWLQHMLTTALKDSFQLITAITYGIWNARNKKIFEGKDIPARETVEKAISALHEYKLNTIPDNIHTTEIQPLPSCNNTRWSPPPRNSLKLNVDAHLKDDGRLGLGLVLRGEDGSIVGAATKAENGSENVELSEVMGLVEAIKMIEERHLQNVIIEMDSAVIVRAIQRDSYPRKYWGKLAESCARVLKDRNDITLQWTSKKGNEAAHQLARWAISEPNRFWTQNYPICIMQQAQKDLPSVTCLV
jgi:ribonuclease HI